VFKLPSFFPFIVIIKPASADRPYRAFLAACPCVCHHCVYTLYAVMGEYRWLLACGCQTVRVQWRWVHQVDRSKWVTCWRVRLTVSLSRVTRGLTATVSLYLLVLTSLSTALHSHSTVQQQATWGMTAVRQSLSAVRNVTLLIYFIWTAYAFYLASTYWFGQLCLVCNAVCFEQDYRISVNWLLSLWKPRSRF